MASPSGLACDVTTKRCRCRMASTMSRKSVGVEITVPLLVLVVQLAQDLLDTILVHHRFVELEMELRHPAQLQALADALAEEAGGALQRLRRLAAGGLVSQCRVVDARDLEIGRDLHAGQGDEADARVVHLAAAQQHAQLLPDLVADAIRTVAGHYTGIATRSIENTSMTSPTLMSL